MAKSQYPSEKLDQYMLRLPDGMRDALKEIAARNGRSLNQEIVHRLSVSLGWIQLPEIPGHDRDETAPMRIGAHASTETADITSQFYSQIEGIIERTIRKVRAEERASGLPPLETDE